MSKKIEVTEEGFPKNLFMLVGKNGSVVQEVFLRKREAQTKNKLYTSSTVKHYVIEEPEPKPTLDWDKLKEQILIVLADYASMSSDFIDIKTQQEGTRIQIANRIIANAKLIAGEKP